MVLVWRHTYLFYNISIYLGYNRTYAFHFPYAFGVIFLQFRNVKLLQDFLKVL